MSTREEELEQMKRDINLSEYAAAHGYEIYPRGSSSHHVCMRSDTDKILIGQDANGRWLYCSVRDDSDRGSILDFAARRHGWAMGPKRINIGKVRQELRPWISGSHIPDRPPASSFVKKLEPVIVDLEAVRAAYNAAESVHDFHPYLCQARAIPAALLASERFSGRVRRDNRGNALFPHWNLDGEICGFELKNDGFTGFAKHGQKGLWGSRKKDSDDRLAICETAIDALSYAVLSGHERTRFLSTSGMLSPLQPGILNLAMRRLPRGCEVVMAVDHDDGGNTLIDLVEPIFRNVQEIQGRDDLTWKIDRPAFVGADWNDVLRGDPASRPAPGFE